MFELFAIGVAQAVQEAPPPALAQSGGVTVRDAGLMTWWQGGAHRGQVMFSVEIAPGLTDRIVSVSSSAGPVGGIKIYRVRGGKGELQAEGDLTLAPPSRDTWFKVFAELPDLTGGKPTAVDETLTVVFERAGTVTVRTHPVSPV